MSFRIQSRRNFIKNSTIALTALALIAFLIPELLNCLSKSKTECLPNFIVIFCDDLGYGDIGCYGSRHKTPHIDRIAKEGMKLTSFYVSSSVCTPSRASLLTGCYSQRIGMHIDPEDRCVLFPVSPQGLNPSEITIAEMLKEKQYATACIGKWHLGD